MQELTHPDYFDLQVNGYFGADFNSDNLTIETARHAIDRLKTDGVAGILATVITDEIPAMQRRLARIVALREQDDAIRAMIAGVHIEGPFLNPEPGYIGAHPAHAAMPADTGAMASLLDAAAGLTRIVTLSPECDPGLAVTRMLADQGVVVSSGHANPTGDQLDAAIDAGLTMITHLGNGCPLQMHRHDNIIQRVLARAERLWIGFIADGVHVPYFALSNYLRAAGLDRCFVVTDAIAAAGRGPGRFTLGDQEVLVDEHLATWAPDRSHLMGSAGTMPRTAANLSDCVGLGEAEVRRLASANPRRALGQAARDSAGD